MTWKAHCQGALVPETGDRRQRFMSSHVRRICWLTSAVLVCMLLSEAEMLRAAVTSNILTRVFALRTRIDTGIRVHDRS